MYQSKSCLPHLLPPESYFEESFFEAERDCVLRDAWHLVGTTDELSKHGDFITLELAGVPLQIRNFEGEICGLLNVCAHRHATICSLPSGNSPRMQCQYHGWEYHSDGATGKIPQPKNFVPFDRQALRLPRFQISTVGQLVFANLAANPASLRDFLGSEMHTLLETRFGMHWKLSMAWRPEYPVNWKIPVENSLEAYHVPNVHPETFREDPGSDRSEHVLTESRTAMGTQLPFSPHSRLDAMFQKLESRFVRWLGYPVTSQYWQHHVFPNLLFSFTDAISLVNCVLPTSATESFAIIRQFGRGPNPTSSMQPIKRLAARCWGRLAASLTRRVLLEDKAIFASIQRGLESSPHRGILGICEERIHRFQQFVDRKTSSNPKGKTLKHD